MSTLWRQSQGYSGPASLEVRHGRARPECTGRAGPSPAFDLPWGSGFSRVGLL